VDRAELGMTDTPFENEVSRLLGLIDYAFEDRAPLIEALTHRSFVNEAAAEVTDNERLEFLGDAVIDLAVSAELMRRFPDAQEGSLSRMRSSMVSESGLAAAARTVGLGDALRLGRGEDLSGGRDRSSLLADAFEALMASVYLDGGFDAVRQIVVAQLKFPDASGRLPGDPKTDLQERMQASHRVTPRYRVVQESGPDHNKTFTVEILCDEEVLGVGSGQTKKVAEQNAAASAIAVMERAEAEDGGPQDETAEPEPDDGR
jgi:ribonuclease III